MSNNEVSNNPNTAKLAKTINSEVEQPPKAKEEPSPVPIVPQIAHVKSSSAGVDIQLNELARSSRKLYRPIDFFGTSSPKPSFSIDGSIREQTIKSQGRQSTTESQKAKRVPSILPTAPSVSEKASEPAPEPQQPALVRRWMDRGVLLPNLQNPRSYTKRQKILIVIVVAIASFCAPFTSNILMPTFPFIGSALRLTSTEVTLTSKPHLPMPRKRSLD